MTLIDQLTAELDRAEHLHPIAQMVYPYDWGASFAVQCRAKLQGIQDQNAREEKEGIHCHHNICLEEFLEIFAAETKEKMREEIVHTITTLVRLDRWLEENEIR